MLDTFKQQYKFIQSTRETLFAFLDEIPLQKLHDKVPDFGSGSIIQTHIHVADCYQYWLGYFALKRAHSFAVEDEIKLSSIQNVCDRFESVDELVYQFIDKYDTRWLEHVENQVRWQEQPLSTTPLWLLTHAETHEFHHKGQIVAMARHLGYVPPDTDLVL